MDAIVADESAQLVALLLTPLVLFFFVLFFGVMLVSRKVDFCYADSATTSFHCTGRKFELAIALTAFASRPMVAVSTVIGPLIEVPLMLTIVYLAKKLEWRLLGTKTAGACPVQESHAEVRSGAAVWSVLLARTFYLPLVRAYQSGSRA